MGRRPPRLAPSAAPPNPSNHTPAPTASNAQPKPAPANTRRPPAREKPASGTFNKDDFKYDPLIQKAPSKSSKARSSKSATDGNVRRHKEADVYTPAPPQDRPSLFSQTSPISMAAKRLGVRQSSTAFANTNHPRKLRRVLDCGGRAKRRHRFRTHEAAQNLPQPFHFPKMTEYICPAGTPRIAHGFNRGLSLRTSQVPKGHLIK